ncbi:hypothetical protein CVO74_18190 [Xanthomonas prunicola]|uniref:Uncharacterized protein n=1 Tax=Xanthomonas prunicola TaxID=2053930 RepID=A0A2N3RG60_9XANT|nr:hypothetical protein XpruCFBP8353_18215 [Xanthomonas prunicola]PKV15816.1 hypothetical protein XpruCFBP8354_17515 [Xanthomonas prunicola]PKV20029.1 hypothetical protein CVO74_18190 [Xanthomonas prunicola]PMR86122.1 hypothetical protein C1H21_19395 [Xanthomonas arboricola pv. juglandis]PPT49746.1 hypothetical protein XarjCFBP7652_07480 [Xanthomonas arboricola]
MKNLIWILVLFFAGQAEIQAQSVYEKLVCRDNDPFVFCTQGCKGADKNWIAIDPISGTTAPMLGYCVQPSLSVCCKGPYCGPWTQTGIDAYYQYKRICPKAMKRGSWNGKRPPENVPHDH